MRLGLFEALADDALVDGALEPEVQVNLRTRYSRFLLGATTNGRARARVLLRPSRLQASQARG